MRIVFMGTPDFAVPALERLLADGHDVVGVFTQADKPKGRGKKIQPPPVKECALENGIPVFQPLSLKTGEALDSIRKLSPELIVVIAYGKILPKEILALPKYGCINIHASLLPKYRGASPIQSAVLNGEKLSGVTSMLMNEGLDTGDILIKKSTPVDENDTYGTLHDKLMLLGAQVLSDTVIGLEKGILTAQKQDDSLATYTGLLDKSLCPIDWNKSANEIHNKIRGLNPWPIATSVIGGKKIKIHQSKVSDLSHNSQCGEVIESGKRLVVACGGATAIELQIVQAQGKKAMNSSDFLRGNKISCGNIFEGIC